MLWMVWPVILSNRFHIQPSPKFLLKGLCAIRSCNNCAKPPLNFKKKLTTHKKSLQQIPTTREFEATGIGDAASCKTPCKRKSQSDWAQLGDKNIVWRRASERVGYDYEEKILIPQPTLSEAPVVSTLLSPSCASLQARTLAWCFASFGISDAFTCAFIYPLPPTR